MQEEYIYSIYRAGTDKPKLYVGLIIVSWITSIILCLPQIRAFSSVQPVGHVASHVMLVASHVIFVASHVMFVASYVMFVASYVIM